MLMSSAVCAACRHSIDAAARICPYCGANPATGEKIDTTAIVQEVFKPKHMTTSESVLEYARHRQGIVIVIGVALAFLILAGLHQYATIRNNTEVANGPAVPLSDVADLSDQPTENQQIAMPDLSFQYDGHPQTMRTYIVEPGAVAPPQNAAPQNGALQNGAPASAGGSPAISPQPAKAGAPPAQAGAQPAKAGVPSARSGAPR